MKNELLTFHFREFPGKFLSRKTNQVGGGDDGNVVERKDPSVEVLSSKVHSNSSRDEGPQEVDVFGHSGGAAEEDLAKADGVYTSSTTLAIRMDAGGNFMAIMVDLPHSAFFFSNIASIAVALGERFFVIESPWGGSRPLAEETHFRVSFVRAV